MAWPGEGRLGWPLVPEGAAGSSTGWRLPRSGIAMAANVSRGAADMDDGLKLTGSVGSFAGFTVLPSVLRCRQCE